MYKIVASFIAVLFVAGCASSPKEAEVKSDLVKGHPYYLVGANLRLEVSRIGGDKTIQYLSQEALAARFKSSLTRKMLSNNMVTEDAAQAQANLDVTLNFKRTFVAMTNRRMNPIMSFELTAHKDGKVLAKYTSGTYTSGTRMYAEKTDDDEYAVVDLFADKIVEEIKKLER
jgi:hypothetical protein